MKYIINFFIFSTLLLAKYSSSQIQTLQTIRDIAKTIPSKTGQTYENTLAAICITESSAGVNIIGDKNLKENITKASLGPMQIRIQTARYLGNKYTTLDWINNLNDKDLANVLLKNVECSAQISAYLLIDLEQRRSNYFQIVSGYNGGIINKPYFYRVARNLKDIHQMIKKGILK